MKYLRILTGIVFLVIATVLFYAVMLPIAGVFLLSGLALYLLGNDPREWTVVRKSEPFVIPEDVQ